LRQLELENLSLAQAKTRQRLRVFVGGPYVHPSFEVEPDKTKYGGAAWLRWHICRYLRNDLEHDVTVGENEKLSAIYEGHLEELYEASTYEMLHVKDHTDCVIILPSSAGSFCELGYFASDDEICSKMMILRDISYQKEPGYLHFGPSEQARISHSDIHDVNYLNVEEVKEKVRAFMRKIALRLIRNRVRIR
jgi:hypothetical protein